LPTIDRRLSWSVSLVVLLALLLADPAQRSLDGLWRNSTGSVIVAIKPCGAALCGTVEWASEQAQADARRGGTDPLIGVEVLSRFEMKRPGRWRGKLFVPDVNRRATAELRLLDGDQLKVTGCALAGLICKSEVWIRADAQ